MGIQNGEELICVEWGKVLSNKCKIDRRLRGYCQLANIVNGKYLF